MFAIFGLVFGILGIVTIGAVFVPLAALCTVIGIIFALLDLSIPALFVSFINLFLVAAGFILSPSLWLLTLAIIGASH